MTGKECRRSRIKKGDDERNEDEDLFLNLVSSIKCLRSVQ